MAASIPLYVHSHPAADADRLKRTLDGVSIYLPGSVWKTYYMSAISSLKASSGSPGIGVTRQQRHRSPATLSWSRTKLAQRLGISTLTLTLLSSQRRASATHCSLLPEITSTQTLLHETFTRFPDGTVCVADVQTSGKGKAVFGRSICAMICAVDTLFLNCCQPINIEGFSSCRPWQECVDLTCGLLDVHTVQEGGNLRLVNCRNSHQCPVASRATCSLLVAIHAVWPLQGRGSHSSSTWCPWQSWTLYKLSSGAVSRYCAADAYLWVVAHDTAAHR